MLRSVEAQVDTLRAQGLHPSFTTGGTAGGRPARCLPGHGCTEPVLADPEPSPHGVELEGGGEGRGWVFAEEKGAGEEGARAWLEGGWQMQARVRLPVEGGEEDGMMAVAAREEAGLWVFPVGERGFGIAAGLCASVPLAAAFDSR